MHGLIAGTAIFAPLLGPQTEAFFSQADELFYGGAAGGGKTYLLLGLGAESHRRSIIFRREYAQLNGADGLISKSREMLGATGATYNGTHNIWRDIPGDRVIEFGAVQHEKDVEKFQGSPHDLICFDELPHFTESQYAYLIGWNRTTFKGQRTRIVAAGNPPLTPEGDWIISRWSAWLDPTHPNPAKPGEIRWYAIVDGKEVELEGGKAFAHKGEIIQPKSRTFIPASVEDNPYLLETGYRAQLQQLPEPMRSKLLYGDFHVGFEDDPYQVIPTAWVLAAQERWRSAPKPDVPLTMLGVDVARGGDDKTVIAARYGNWIAPLSKYPGKDTPDGPSVVMRILQHIEPSIQALNVDVIGVGASVFDLLRIQQVPALRGINFAESSRARDRSGKLGMVNKRAEFYWALREALDPERGEGLALPDDRELRADLCAARWKMTTRGVQIEQKDDIKARIGRSPDCADAVALCAMTRRSTGSPFGYW